ncbi:ABC transporter permease subunit [Thermosipho atlanticus]|uniref:ABC-2 family transporter protein n=1 Tax=Thermosipho atlanticus DSM 15807 TaxID=1123380 RepID=A0A1M5U5I1_9BACT|nr:ABC transporter permease subunit [Thermosipho atlanticus]SHH58198.1 ABC-2 family transporter protein [Thermosipho atlanticus DSM 15807]
MKKEWEEMKLRAIIIFIILFGIFISLAPLQNWTINILNEYSSVTQKYVNKDFVEALKKWDFYIYSQWFGKNFGQFIPIIAIIFAFPLFSREYENGTMDFLLTRASRKRVFLNKFSTSFIVLLVEITILSLLPLIYSILFSKELNSSYTSKFLIHSLIGAIFWYSLTLVFTVQFNDQVKPILFPVAILAISTALGILRPLKILNTYNYILGSTIFKTGSIDWKYSITLALLSVILIIFSYIVFKRKEI